MRSAGDALAAAGFPVLAVRLAGHSTSVRDLARTRWTHWAASVREGAEELAARGPILVVGMSLGALLGLHLTATWPGERIRGLVCCGTPLHLPDRRLRALPWLFRVPGARRFGPILPKGGRDIGDPDRRGRSHAYDAMPLASVAELLKLQRTVRRLLARVRVPTLVLHGREDHAAPVANAELLARSVAGPAEVRVFERSWHVITEDVEQAEVAAAIVAFCERHAG